MMNRHITIIVVICLSCIPVLAETITFRDGIHIHWSRKDKIVSPEQTWELDIVPPEDENNPTPVYLRKPGQDKTHLLFQFDRDGMIFWQGDALFVEDMQSSSTYSIMLFNPLSKYPNQSRSLVIDDVVRAEVRRKIKSSEIIHYYPRLVSWTENKLVVSVGIDAVKEKVGPYIPLDCLGYEIDAQSLEIKTSLTEKELMKKYNTDCRDWWP